MRRFFDVRSAGLALVLSGCAGAPYGETTVPEDVQTSETRNASSDPRRADAVTAAATPAPSAPSAPEPPKDAKKPEVVTVTWNAVSGTATYSLDLVLNNGDVIAPCVATDVIVQDTSLSFDGLCVSPDIRVRMEDVKDFRICSAEDDDWRAAICTRASWNGTAREVKIAN